MAAITVREAAVKTATVEIKCLTVSGRQVTMGVFRQLQKEPLVGDDIELQGEPWGKVNYFFGDCHDNHLHVVWQKGEELRRACVWPTPGSERHVELRRGVEVAHCAFVMARYLADSQDQEIREFQFGSVYTTVMGVRLRYGLPDDLKTALGFLGESWAAIHTPKVRALLEKIGLPHNLTPEDAWISIGSRVEKLKAYEDAWHERYEEMDALDQLFIAV